MKTQELFKTRTWAPDFLVAPLVLLLLVALLACADTRTVSTRPPSRTAWVDSVLEQMTLEEKIGQLFTIFVHGRFYNVADPQYQDIVVQIEDLYVGGLIFSTGDPISQALLANDLQSRARTPLLVAQDLEWGLGMRLTGTTSFPRAMSLGAAGRPELAYAVGRVIADEARSLGVHMNYAPVADVNNNPDNPVINTRSFGEDPLLVAEMAAAYVRGLEDGGLLATAKHFPGHGDTDVDSHARRTVIDVPRERLDSLEFVPFRASLAAGASAVMVAHVALPAVTDGDLTPATLSQPIIEGLLREDLNFDGLVVTDAMVMRAVSDHFGTGEAAVRALEAGADILLMSPDIRLARRAVVSAVEERRLTPERIDQSVRRILKAKYRAGLDRYRPTDIESVRRKVASPGTVALAEEIARQSVTLLRNENDLIPLERRDLRILEVTLSDSDYPDQGRSFLALLREKARNARITHRLVDRRTSEREIDRLVSEADNYDVVLVQAHVYVRTGSNRIGLDDDQRRFMQRLHRKARRLILVSFGDPYIARYIPAPEVYVAGFGASDAVEMAVAEGLFGEIPFKGRLPITIPDGYPIGSGIQTVQTDVRFGRAEEVGMRSDTLARLDRVLWSAIEDTAFPAAALVVGRNGVVVKSQAYGYFTYDSEQRVTTRSVFDLASLTKVIATTPAVMMLYERDLIDLEAPLAAYIPEFAQSGKDSVTVRQVLTHTAGLAPFYPLEIMGVTEPDSILAFIARDSLIYEPDSSYRYSDLGMIMLAEAVERITGRPLSLFLRDSLYRPLGMHDTGFRPAGGAGIDTTIVPTEVDIRFRGRLVQGEVHDERAWMLGGTAGHAGLFSTAEDLARFAHMIVNDGAVGQKRFFKPETIKLFTTRFQNELDHTRALGWDTKTIGGYSSAGSEFGPNSFGHTGFTGTSFWIDPDQQLFVILLTNRVYPTRANRKIYDVRPHVADISYRAIAGPPEFLFDHRYRRNHSTP